jgi:hypothetical protein
MRCTLSAYRMCAKCAHDRGGAVFSTDLLASRSCREDSAVSSKMNELKSSGQPVFFTQCAWRAPISGFQSRHGRYRSPIDPEATGDFVHLFPDRQSHRQPAAHPPQCFGPESQGLKSGTDTARPDFEIFPNLIKSGVDQFRDSAHKNNRGVMGAQIAGAICFIRGLSCPRREGSRRYCDFVS